MNLSAMLVDGIRFAPNYQPSGNSDHLPMALCALAGLGADEKQMDAFRLDYMTRLQERKAKDSYSEQLELNLIRIQKQGVQAILAEDLPALLPSIALEAFHPVIRLGYALMFHSDEEVAAALAYWQSVHEPFPWQQNLETDLELALQQQTPIRLQEQRFGGRIRELRELGQYPQARSDLASCRKVALKVYQCTRNFFALHLVTSCQALQCCVAEVDDPELEATAEAAMASAILAAHLVLDAPQLALGTVAELPPRLDPEHAYKYVYSCLVEYHSSGNLAYLEEAKGFKAQGLVPDWVVLE